MDTLPRLFEYEYPQERPAREQSDGTRMRNFRVTSFPSVVQIGSISVPEDVQDIRSYISEHWDRIDFHPPKINDLGADFHFEPIGSPLNERILVPEEYIGQAMDVFDDLEIEYKTEPGGYLLLSEDDLTRAVIALEQEEIDAEVVD